MCSQNRTAATAARARYQSPAGENTCTSGSAVAKARMIPPRATDSSAAPTRSASRTDRHQSRRSTSGRGATSSQTTKATPRTTVSSPSWDHQIDPPSENGTNGPPRSTELTRLLGCRITSSIEISDQREQHDPDPVHAPPERVVQVDRPVDTRCGTGRTIWTTRSPGQGGHRGGEDEADGEVDPEDVAPGAEGEHDRAVQRAEDAAELLDGADHAERDSAAVGGVEVGDQGQGHRHQAAAAHALEEATGHQALEVVRRSGDQRAEGEDDQRGDQHRGPSAQVRDPADQGEHRDVPEQEAAHDRGRPLELVDAQPDRAHHVRQREHHHVGVGRGERDRDGRQGQQQPGGPVGSGDRIRAPLGGHGRVADQADGALIFTPAS